MVCSRKKRKGDEKTDEVEDGARAAIVEELVIKAIHAEGERIARVAIPTAVSGKVRLFPSKTDVSFAFLKRLKDYVRGLEVESNKYWEWEDAIVHGARVFYELCREGQGTVTIDVERRELLFRPDVTVDIRGSVYGVGSAVVQMSDLDQKDSILRSDEQSGFSAPSAESRQRVARIVATKQAVLQAVGIDHPSLDYLGMVTVKIAEGRVSIKTSGAVREKMWKRQILTFSTTISEASDQVICTALAISDPK